MRLPLLIAIALVLLPAVAAAELTVDVRTGSSRPVIDTSKSRAQIQAIDKERFSRVTGLTVSKLVIGIESRYQLRGRPGSWCIKDIHAIVTVRFQPVTVYIPREFFPGSCAYRAISAHEMKHVRANHRVIQKVTPLIRGIVSRAYRRRNGNLCGRTQDSVKTTGKTAIEEAMQTITEHAEREGDVLQKRVDTPAEYKRVSRSCKVWPGMR